MPYVATPPHHALHGSSRTIDRRPDIEEEDRLARRFGGSGVVIDDVADFFRLAVNGASLDVPVVAVEWWFAATVLSQQ